MKYTIVTATIADEQLAKLWLAGPDRDVIAEASNQIETSLKHNPEDQGRLHPGGWRVISCGPLVATFRVKPSDRIVRILSYFRVG